jgi:2-polyprenyl-3-methyl-5-hydroxy-6-metoxy-1,4-benzoquinol methylase
MTMILRPDFEHTACDFCGNSQTEILFEGPDRLLNRPGRFRVVRCTYCGLLRQDPRPTKHTIQFYYPPEYEPFSIAIDDENSWLVRLDRRYGMIKRRRAVEQCCPGGRLLDVGCATGNFLYEMKRSGRWQVEGVEPNPEAARYAKERFGLIIHVGDLTTVNLPEKSYDVITMWDVFEHLHEPMTNLKIIKRLLKPGGWFIFSIPNIESWERKIFGKYWLGWELPRHLYFPSKQMMETMLHNVGIKLYKWKCIGGAYQSFLFSLRFWLEGVFGRNAFTHSIIFLSRTLPIRFLFSPFFWIITRLNRASIIAGFANVDFDR